MGCRDFGAAYCAPVPFSTLLLLRRKQKTAAQRVCSVPLYALTVLTKATPGYIQNQLQEDQIADQISIKEFVDPFTGSKNTKA